MARAPTDRELVLRALRSADVTYRQADAHRTDLMQLARSLGVPTADVMKVLGHGGGDDGEG